MNKWVSVVVGVLLVLFGSVWTLQGLNVIKGSFMTGQQLWTAIGLLAVIGGVTLAVSGLRKKSSR
ncbi:hypothetical protein ACFFQW_09425 [Umezawaea endophytica]|uniref:Uncharacterized protein n=1 Tax=Umezawaea endophytica TaxID=1654476 RepID=A0A9X3A4I5_9PSEU|nr:hypothetical protein [Umezawaea endophytica]MCS7481303.1 hypothetical protein [Umezawaea endophytica]